MRNIFRYFEKQRFLCALFAVLGVITILLSILEPKLTAEMVTAITAFDLGGMAKFAVFVAMTAISVALVKYVFRNTSVRIQARVGKQLQADLCERALNVKSSFLADFKSGELTEITKSDSAKFLEHFQNVAMLVFSLITSVAVAVYTVVLSWQCALLFGCFVAIIFGIQKYSLGKEKENSEKEKSNNDSAKSLVNQIYTGILDVKVLNLKAPLFAKYEALLDREIDAAQTKHRVVSSNRLFANVAFEVYVLGFMLLGVWLMQTGQLTLDVFITIFMYKSYLYNLVFDVAELRSALSEMRVLAGRMNKLLQIDEHKLERFGPLDDNLKDAGMVSRNEIRLKSVSFAYPFSDRNVLENVSFTMQEGEFIGVVGESGSAKTTLIKLLSRQLEPTAGDVKLNGLSFKHYSEQGFTSLVSLASQEPYVFSFSIRENLLMVKPNATESEMWKALEDAQIAAFVRSLPSGLDTALKETLNISGGQKQRLSLARLFLKDTPIILMDEATSALDNRTQAEITVLIQQKARENGKLFVCIAHRIEAVQNADKILFLDGGKIAGCGTHEELLQEVKYRKLLNKKIS